MHLGNRHRRYLNILTFYHGLALALLGGLQLLRQEQDDVVLVGEELAKILLDLRNIFLMLFSTHLLFFGWRGEHTTILL